MYIWSDGDETHDKILTKISHRKNRYVELRKTKQNSNKPWNMCISEHCSKFG